MACNTNRFDANCEGCRHCCGTGTLTGDSPGTTRPNPVDGEIADVRRRERAAGARRSLLIRNRHSN